MININLDEQQSILYVKPTSALNAKDFAQLSDTINNYVKQHGTLKGFLIETERFPGWDNINAFFAHMKFIKNHHTKIQKIALVTNSKFASTAEKYIGPYIKAKIKHFPHGQAESAKQWIEQS